eukprot:TRINITY_DN47023_c0_g1_i1.p1 TRINITY_DN47023_c0_g1~~TRINITY_DN47023_c0_g1_i1.p1  ORF type:complete len:125 (+),score=46.65 TRINITY_DN47023_c0_g1_i1:86-460(+)
MALCRFYHLMVVAGLMTDSSALVVTQQQQQRSKSQTESSWWLTDILSKGGDVLRGSYSPSASEEKKLSAASLEAGTRRDDLEDDADAETDSDENTGVISVVLNSELQVAAQRAKPAKVHAGSSQ